jgi:UDP-GlcNAc:undecaprenyl-phosphate/decaprenyl-phosphate GlcNAc-1-phosphate transferase
VPLAARIGRRVGLVDYPGGRRRHQGIVPRTGGLALFGGFFVTVLLTLLLPALLPPAWDSWFPPRNDPEEMRRLTALLVGALFCVGAGYLDDRFELGSTPQYGLQLVAALIGISGAIFIKHINNPLTDSGYLWGPDGLPWWLMLPITLFWYVGMMNTINWLDGLSGLVAGVTAILCTILALHMLFAAEPPQLSVAILPVALLGAAVGFLPANLPARIFMGSTGSYFLGFAVAALGIIGGARLATVMLVMGLPALDVAWLIFDRSRRGVRPGQGGRDHLHFRLLDRGLQERTIVAGYWGFCALFGALTLLLDDRIYKLAALLGLGVAALAVMVWASRVHPVPDSQIPDSQIPDSHS